MSAETSNDRAIMLIARREISTRLRSKAFRVATLISILILVGIALVSKISSGGPSYQDVGVTPAAASTTDRLTAVARALHIDLRVHDVGEAAGRARVRDGELDGLLVGDDPAAIDVVVQTGLDDDLRSVLQLVAQRAALDRQVSALGGDPATVSAAVAGARVRVTPLERPTETDGQQLALGIITSVLIYMSLLINGQAVAQGVVEEKTSRVVEILLATVRPRQLLIGKVLGLGTVGLIQMAAIALCGIVAGTATGALHMHASATAGTVVWLIIWFLLGYTAYSLAFAGVASLVSRQEDVAAVVTPVLMLLIVGYVIGVSILPSTPDSGFVAALSLIPIFAPTLMPVRLALGVVPAWQAVVSLGGIVVAIPLLLWLSARIYQNAVLHSGARVRLRDAWRTG
ncbi:ABC transporter permease [Mangrovihabitans endophyticus]|uniref:ABC transporter permease n=1 Tax=Mangrovihabitans endophyticus TaxID=1751298 RepID=A0A8J3C3Z2_9ACTN|nr:ABC transporter permease [Mangrovihabitans endophyticus]GGL07033.1 ABC transporter permease [Mangrovihabitans endophyticus]